MPLKVGFLQVAADTVLFTPVYVAAFFAFMNSVEGGNFKVTAPRDYSAGAEALTEISRWLPAHILACLCQGTP